MYMVRAFHKDSRNTTDEGEFLSQSQTLIWINQHSDNYLSFTLWENVPPINKQKVVWCVKEGK